MRLATGKMLAHQFRPEGSAMFERYTERARRVIFFARYEASQFGSLSIETEHLLLGLLREDSNLEKRFFPDLSPANSIRTDIEGRLPVREKVATSIDLPLSNECKRILAYAGEEADRLNYRLIGTEHMLLAILREEHCMAAKVLQERGLRLNPIRETLAHARITEGAPEPLEPRPFSSLTYSPALPKSGVVPDGDTAKRIAEAVWTPLYGAQVISAQTPLRAELTHNVWIVTGSSVPDGALFVFILQSDGRILSLGRGSSES
jgi:hypothetical protein